MTSSLAQDATPVLVSVRLSTQPKYPLYGEVKLNPPMPLKDALYADSVVIGRDLAIRLGVKVGDTVKLGGQNFRVASLIEERTGPNVWKPEHRHAPDDVARSVRDHGPDADRQSRGGASAVQARPRHAVEDVRKAIKAALPESVVADFRESHPIITIGLDRATTFLSLSDLIALIVGAVGVGMAMHAHLQQKMDNIAVMKSLGATSGEIIRIFTIQTMMLGLLGGLGGVIVGRGVAEISRCTVRGSCRLLRASDSVLRRLAAQG